MPELDKLSKEDVQLFLSKPTLYFFGLFQTLFSGITASDHATLKLQKTCV